MQTRKRKYIIWRLPGARSLIGYVQKHKMEDLVNGRNNTDSSKVAKFIDI